VSNPPRDDRTRYAPSSNDIQPTRNKAPGDFAVGEVIAGSYKVLSFIGRGGMGAVYRVHHMFLDKELALKTLSGDQITEVAWKRFQIEGQAIARLDHTNIIRIYDLGITGQNQPYYVMELVEGISLGQLLQEQGALKVDFALRVFRQVAAGLAYAHEHGIVHRDLKPVNIMLLPNPKSDVPVAKVLDFGLAKLTDLAGGSATGLTRTGEIFGSPLYMSPEQAQGLPIGPATDIYSFGCSLFEALTGDVPFRGASAVETMLMHQSKEPPTLAEMRPDLEFSPQLENLIAKLLAKKTSSRYRSFAEVASQLLLIERPQDATLSGFADNQRKNQAKDQEESSNEYTDPPPSSMPSQRWFWPALIAATLVVIGTVGAIAYFVFTPAAPKKHDTTNTGATATISPSPAPAPAQAPTPDTERLSGTQTYSHLGVENGVPVRIFDFPKDTDLGLITYALDQDEKAQAGADWKRLHGDAERNPFTDGMRARGRVVTRRDLGVEFTPEDHMCNTPAKFKLFKEDDLVKLDLSNNEYVNSDFMPFVRHLKQLQELFLDDTGVDDKAIKVLDGFTKLKFLRVDHTKITGAALGKSPVLDHLLRLSFSANEGTSALLEAVKDKKNIIELRLDGTALTKDDLLLLAHMPNLTKLDVNACDIGDDGLKILAQSKSLTKLVIRDKKITPASMPTFVKMKLVKLTLSEENWTRAEQGQLRVAMAKLPRYCLLEFKSVAGM